MSKRLYKISAKFGVKRELLLAKIWLAYGGKFAFLKFGEQRDL
ncbi:MAG: hypothetical protein ACFNUU_02315 [Campylobacter sp.]